MNHPVPLTASFGAPVSAVTTHSTPDTCRLCARALKAMHGDSMSTRLCFECKKKPEARHLSAIGTTKPAPPAPRAFNAADKALIKAVHGFMPTGELLSTLNARLAADDAAASPFTLAQLDAEIRELAERAPPAGGDWAGLRKLLAGARASGLLASITPQMLQDFAVIFSLTPAQSVRMRDIVAGCTDDGDDA